MSEGLIKIQIPLKRKKVSSKKALTLVAKKSNKKWLICSSDKKKYDFEIQEKYWPYWIAEITTIKERLFFKPKKITFFVVCDAVSSNYTVLRGLPPFQEYACSVDMIEPSAVNRKKFGEIITNAIQTRIEKQFIFGPPLRNVEHVYRIHIPGWYVKILDKSTGEQNGFFVNSITGELKKVMSIMMV